MSIPFDPRRGLVIVPTVVEGPGGNALLRLALDTGASGTVINSVMLATLGYDLALARQRTEVTTGSGVEFATCITLQRITALEQERDSFPILGLTLPPSAKIDGLLGLDFLRGQTLTVDFRTGTVNLS